MLWGRSRRKTEPFGLFPLRLTIRVPPKAADLFNECGGTQLGSLSELDLTKVPLMDVGGREEFVAYVFAGNYFELYVNGQLVAVNPVPFTPFTRFNTNVVRFKAKRPVTLAAIAVDWEANLGLGVEDNRGKRFHPGDSGFVAMIKDAKQHVVALTDENWRAQTFCTAALKTHSCLVVTGPPPPIGCRPDLTTPSGQWHPPTATTPWALTTRRPAQISLMCSMPKAPAPNSSGPPTWCLTTWSCCKKRFSDCDCDCDGGGSR